MPLYEYECEACAHRFEVIQKYADAPIDICPRCSGVVRKLFSSPAIQFKGTGWYITDYARAGKSDSAATGPSGGKGDSTKGEGSSSDSKTDSKSESKAESKSEAKSDAKSDSSGSKGETKSETKSDSKPSTSS